MKQDTITYFAETDYRNKRTRFGIKASDRSRHMYVIGKTGMGKSTLLENMAIQDIQNGEGMAFIDPHGGTVEKLLDYIPEHRIQDVVYFAPFDLEYPMAFNVMENIGADKRHLVASGLMSTFKKIWVDAWSARMEYILNNTILALLEYPEATLMGVNKMLSDKEFRKTVLEHVTDPSVKSFWIDEFAKYTERMAQEAVPAIQNKIGQFTANPLIRNIISQPTSSFDIRDMMDKKKILLINLSKGRIGEQNAALLGGMLITKIYLAAMSRADISASTLESLPSFYFFVDEFQSFASDSFADILSEARKYKLAMTITHQYVEQMGDEVKAAVFGNVGTMVIFRVGSTDADIFEKEFAPVFTAEDIVNLDKRQIYLRLMIDGVGSKPFSAVTLPPIQIAGGVSFREQVIAASRQQYTTDRKIVEDKIKIWIEAGRDTTEKKPKKPYDPSYVPKSYQGQQGTQYQSQSPSQSSYQQPQTQPYKKPFAPRPSGPSPKLHDLLQKLEAGDIVPVEDIQPVVQKEIVKPVIPPPPVVNKIPAAEAKSHFTEVRLPDGQVSRDKEEKNISHAPHGSLRDAPLKPQGLAPKMAAKVTGKNNDVLKQALARALEKKVLQPAETVSSQESVVSASSAVPEKKEEPVLQSPQQQSPQKKREVPEDVLRRILE